MRIPPTLLACLLATGSQATSYAVWNDRLSSDERPISGELIASTTSFGIYFQAPAGFVLNATYESEEDTETIDYAAAFDDSGNLRWGAQLASTDSDYQTISETVSSGKLWVGSEQDDGTFRFGLFDATSKVPDFVYAFDLDPEAELEISRGYDDKPILIETKPGNVRIRVLNTAGNFVIDRNFASPDFVGLPDEDGSPFSLIRERPEGGYILSIASTQENAEDATRNDITLSTLFLDASGAIQAENHFSYERTFAVSGVANFPMLLDDGSIVYVIADADVDSVGTTPSSYIVRIHSNGTLAYAKEIENVILAPSPQTQSDSDTITLQGSQMTFTELSAESDIVLLKVAVADGSILDSILIDLQSIDSPIFYPLTVGDSIYLQSSSINFSIPEGGGFPTFENFQYLVKVPTDLSAATAVAVPTSLAGEGLIANLSYHEPSNTFLLSSTDDGEIAAISFEADLSATSDCISFESFEPTTLFADLTATDAATSAADRTVSATGASTPLTPATLALLTWTPTLEDFCDSPPPPPPTETIEIPSRVVEEDGNFFFDVETQTGKTYELQISFTLGSESFAISATFPGTGSTLRFPMATAETAIFYRVREVPPEG